ncbi:DUF1549 and DUF1553 domain-containing protein [Tundrisphaera sp. TA3]|uniref:DUF1549 and DUF1553 domain-containing protein n=1 Tax=Tundrisphaera sp. TA3 TaxID=3435775 RepID=UPI003EBCBB27
MSRRFPPIIASIGALGLAIGCGGRPATPVEPKPAAPAVVATPTPPPPTIRVHPATATIEPGDPGVQMIVDGDGTHGGRKDLTAAVAWTATPDGVVAIDATGFARPVGPGTAKIVAMAGPSRVESTIVVAAKPRAWDFAEDIEPILTKVGCNAGNCHGRALGQNGFHLSLFGYDPEADHRSLTRDLGGRRVSTVRPESSLVVAKATGAIPHVGGARIRPGSDEEKILLGWLRAGAPMKADGGHGRTVRVAVEPGDVRLDEPGSTQLRVVATHADGHTRDVTRLANYRVNDDSAATIDARGRVTLLRRAEADLVIRYQTQVVPTRLATLINPDLAFDFAALPRRNFIDDALFRRLESLKVPPSPEAGDAAFLRRVSLDLTGQQPTPDRIREFLKDVDPDKRVKLVDTLLASRDFTRFWQIKLGDMLEITTSRPELGNAAYNYEAWLAKRLIENTPWDAMVRELLTALGDPASRDGSGAAAYALEATDPKVAAEKTAQRFLGLRIRCAQCHDHPSDVWTQDDYYGLAATFAKARRRPEGGPGMMARAPVAIDPDGSVEHQRTGKPAEPRLLSGEPIRAEKTEDPRVALVAWMTRPDNPYFARAMANWVWAQFFGKGLADPPDDLSRSNPPVHPELLDALARHFVEHRFDLRDLVRTVATSRAYGLSSATVPGNESDQRLFSHQIPRPLTAHQMADALAQATEVVNRYRDKPAGTRAIEIVDPATPSTILETFGRCARINGCAPVANPALSLRQSLLLIGGDAVEGKVSAPRGYLANLFELGLEPEEIVENLYLRSICRTPTAEETSRWAAELAPEATRREVAEDLFWALLNSREFSFNH